jgi:hypothetical protein
MKKAVSLLLFASSAAMADDAAVLKCRALPEAAGRLACYDAMPLAGTARPAAPARADTGFGLPAPAEKKETGPDTVRSTVDGRLDGWSPGTRIRLANGQVWRVTEGDAVLPVLDNPQVEVTRGLLGAYFLQVAGHTSAARVTRVQ